MKKSLITKIIFLLFVVLMVTFCSMNVYTMNFYKAEIEGIEGIDSSVVADISSDASFKLTLAAIVWSVLLMVILAVALNRLIVKPLKGIDNQVKKLTNYNFAKDDTGFIEKNMYRKDEIGQVCSNFESMRLNIVGLLCEINDVCNNLNLNVDNLAEISGVASDTAVQLSSTVNEVASGASDQADEISEGDKQVRMLSDLIGVVQEDMRVLNEATKEVSLLKEAGLEALEIVVHASESNLKNSHSTHEIIMETSEQTKRIQAASSQIRDISEQTNLLALNASIEAARAGEAGRGFAVVASEIGNLATVTNELTATIEEIISDLVIKMSDAVKMIGEMEESTSEESESVTNTQMQFNRIAIHLEKMESLCAQLDSSTRAMEESRTSIVQMIDSLSAISEENAACMEEAAASVEEQAKSIENVSTTSDEVAAMSQKLSKEVGQFTY